ncbi:hypothetical protein [Psychromonas sp. SP041]|uniref:hypothetical protein n=1 Tax=Psychromonas sp. SP041 TaxID=1365007 RepID=UPI00041A2F19|nr:hypothetical protein [Psychromonas sp. SP041]
MTKSKVTLLSKAFHAEYGVQHEGEILKNWCATKVDDELYDVTRADTSVIRVRLGQKVREVGEVGLDLYGNVTVGPHTILKGQNIDHSMTAKKTRPKDEYMISRLGMNKTRIKVGQHLDGTLLVHGKDEHGNLKIGDISIPIEKKIKELKILVFDQKNEKTPTGYNATFSLIEPGKESNNKDGISGVFVPAKGKGPAKFCENTEDAGLMTTAVFWPSTNKSFLVGRIRTLEQAKTEKFLFDSIKQYEKEARDFEIEPCDHFDLVNSKKLLTEINNEWTSYQFSANTNVEMFGLVNKFKRSYEPSGPTC